MMNIKDQYFYKENNGVSINEKNRKLTLHREDGPAVILFENNYGNLAEEIWAQNGVTHRDNGPAMIVYESKVLDNQEIAHYIKRQCWYSEGKKHRVNEPAEQCFNYMEACEDFPTTIYYKRKDIWYNEGKVHRENDDPAEIEYFPLDENLKLEDQVVVKKWYQNGELHRENKPAVLEYDDTKNLSHEEWAVEGKTHRLDGAAKTSYDVRFKNEITSQEWYVDGKLHRENAPSSIGFDIDEVDGNIIKTVNYEQWHLYGLMHRTDGPAFSLKNLETMDFREEWHLNGLYHRENGPALTREIYINNEATKELRWYIEGKLHRENAPALIVTDLKRNIILEEDWEIHGKNHRLDGPAFIERCKDGSLKKEEWWIEGMLIEKIKV